MQYRSIHCVLLYRLKFHNFWLFVQSTTAFTAKNTSTSVSGYCRNDTSLWWSVSEVKKDAYELQDIESVCIGDSLVPASGNVYSSGVRTVPENREPPTFAYPNDDCPQAYSGSRDSYERLLRKLVYTPGERIRWMTGLVSGLQLSSKPGQIDSVSVTCEETKTEHCIPASFVIGIS